MSDTFELGKLMVRLEGDKSALTNALAQGKIEVQQFARDISKTASGAGASLGGIGKLLAQGMEGANASAGGLFEKLAGMAGLNFGGITSMLASFGPAAAVVGVLVAGLSKFIEAEDRSVVLHATLKAMGLDADAVAERYGAMADKIHAATGMARTDIQDLLLQATRQAKNKGQAPELAETAIGLAQRQGTSPEAMLHALTLAQVGHTRALAHTIPELRGITDQTELMNKAQQLSAQGYEIGAAKMGTFTGMVKQVWNAFNDFLKLIGEAVGPVIMPFLKDAIYWVKELVDRGKDILKIQGPIFQVFMALNPITAGFKLLSWLAKTVWEASKPAWNAFRDIVLKVYHIIDVEGRNLWAAVMEAWSEFKDFAYELFTPVREAWNEFVGWMDTAVGGPLRELWKQFVGDAKSSWDQFLNIIGTLPLRLKLVMAYFDVFAHNIPTIVDYIKQVMATFLNWVGENWPATFQNVFTTLMEELKIFGRSVSDLMQEIGESMLNPLHKFNFDSGPMMEDMQKTALEGLKRIAGSLTELKLPGLDLSKLVGGDKLKEIEDQIASKIKELEEARAKRRGENGAAAAGGLAGEEKKSVIGSDVSEIWKRLMTASISGGAAKTPDMQTAKATEDTARRVTETNRLLGALNGKIDELSKAMGKPDWGGILPG